MTDADRLAEIEARVNGATEGPWDSHDFGYAGEQEPSSIVVHTGKFDHADLRDSDTETAIAWMPRWERREGSNAEFIAHARTDVPYLLGLVRTLTAENERLREHIERNGIQWCACSRADRMHDRRVPACPYHGDGMRRQRDRLAQKLRETADEIEGLADSLDEHVTQSDVHTALIELWRDLRGIHDGNDNNEGSRT